MDLLRQIVQLGWLVTNGLDSGSGEAALSDDSGELRRFPCLILADRESNGKCKSTGRRKVDCYELPDHDSVGEIQEIIGGTTAGFPYATREEIEEWTDLSAARAGYPVWLNRQESGWEGNEPEPSCAEKHDG